ncbi:unnamed protein product [Durusdinium trenchii]|uniref:Uncharacterized protein n=1 Tax=Durusdinium trenchii TaxID=1381693 RepID=A0ABP0I4G4_9DINO
MVTSKLCTVIACVHLFCAALMVFTEPSYRWGAHDLQPIAFNPSQIALGAVGINARLQLQVEATRQKLRAADRQVASGFALVAFAAQDVALTLRKTTVSANEGARVAIALLLWDGMLLANYFPPISLLATWQLPTLSVHESFFVLVAGGTVAASVVYLMGLGLWRCLERWLERWRRHLDLWLADARLEGGFRGQNTDTAFVLMMVITKPHGG